MINIIYAALPKRAQTENKTFHAKTTVNRKSTHSALHIVLCGIFLFLESPCMDLCPLPKHIPACRSVLLKSPHQETHFVSHISQPPLNAQKWFCIQNVRMDLSFQEKKDIKIGYLNAETLSKNPVSFFLGYPVPFVSRGTILKLSLVPQSTNTLQQLKLYHFMHLMH